MAELEAARIAMENPEAVMKVIALPTLSYASSWRLQLPSA